MGEEQDDSALRSLAAICIAQFTLTDKENKYTPAVLMAMLDAVVPKELPKLEDEEVKEVRTGMLLAMGKHQSSALVCV